MTQGHSCNLYPQNSWLAKLLHKAPKANFWKPLSHSSHASYFAICKAQSTKASGRGRVPAALPEALSHNIIAEYPRFKDQFGFQVLQLGTRNQKLGTFTSSNHISQNHRLTTENFLHSKQGLSPQNPSSANASSCPLYKSNTPDILANIRPKSSSRKSLSPQTSHKRNA